MRSGPFRLPTMILNKALWQSCALSAHCQTLLTKSKQNFLIKTHLKSSLPRIWPNLRQFRPKAIEIGQLMLLVTHSVQAPPIASSGKLTTRTCASWVVGVIWAQVWAVFAPASLQAFAKQTERSTALKCHRLFGFREQIKFYEQSFRRFI